MLLLPPPAGTCPVCAVKHEPQLPHNATSMYYLYRFYGLRGRWPTWADAIAHCDERTQRDWKFVLRDRGLWTEPEGDDPIADPPAESIRQCVGDLASPTFGPEQGGDQCGA